MDIESIRIAKIDKNVSPNGKPLSELAGAAKYLRRTLDEDIYRVICGRQIGS